MVFSRHLISVKYSELAKHIQGEIQKEYKITNANFPNLIGKRIDSTCSTLIVFVLDKVRDKMWSIEPI